jgi:prepilin-type N-terminal cleavage/methylation domain-containing protein
MSVLRRLRLVALADSDGFTLIETLVAFSVMAIVLSVLFHGVVDMRSGSVIFDARTHQALVARAVLDGALGNRDLANGSYKGLRDGERWTLLAERADVIAPSSETTEASSFPSLAAPRNNIPAWGLQHLVVTVATAGRSERVETIRLNKQKQR